MTNHWLDKSEYPFISNYFDINGHKLHFIDEGQGEIILFVHGTPSWSFENRKIIKELRKNYRCIAFDHIGFGLSDKPEVYDYSTQNHSATLEKFVVDLQLSNITLVVHDFGGPIGLNFAIHSPGLIKRIVIFNSWFWDSSASSEFKKMKKVLNSPLLPFLYRFLNFSPKFLLPKTYGENKPSKRILKHYTKPFSGPRQRNGVLAFAKSLLSDQDWFEKLWNEKGAISNKPVLLIWGMKDPVITPHNLEKFESGFQNSQTIRLESSGHFPQEEEPEKVIEEISNFMRR
jgi:haloalkane dehalogenase